MSSINSEADRTLQATSPYNYPYTYPYQATIPHDGQTLETYPASARYDPNVPIYLADQNAETYPENIPCPETYDYDYQAYGATATFEDPVQNVAAPDPYLRPPASPNPDAKNRRLRNKKEEKTKKKKLPPSPSLRRRKMGCLGSECCFCPLRANFLIPFIILLTIILFIVLYKVDEASQQSQM